MTLVTFARRLAVALATLAAAIATPAAADFARDWRVYKSNFLTPDGRVVDSGNNDISHSESQGTGMLLAVKAGDRAAFNAIWAWTRSTLQRPDRLFAWKWDPAANPPVSDPNNASDGDLLIAWALAEAYKAWGEPAHRDAAQAIVDAIRTRLVAAGDGFLVLKPAADYFDRDAAMVVNSSYYVFPALKSLHATLGAPHLQRLYTDGLFLTETAVFGPRRLPGDWVVVTRQGDVSLWDERPARFGYEAVRVPLYLLWAGECDAPVLASVAHAWRALAFDGRPPAYIDLTTDETPPYRASGAHAAIARLMAACQEGDCARAAKRWPDLPYKEDYYSASLMLFARLAVAEAAASPACAATR